MLTNDCSRTDCSASYAPALGVEHDERDLLFGGHNGVKSQEIMAAVPPKSVVDRMVAGYFLDRPIVPVVLHGPTFLIEYERFWENPLGTSLIWHHSIETLLLYLNIELLRREDAQTEPWMMFGVTVRLAYRMGYHRDATHFPQISPFQGEMRRRIWALIVQLDIFTSAQVGLPRMTRDDQADAAEPRNLLDEDLHQDMQELPPSRPSAVQTEIQYTLLQTKLVLVCGRVFDWVGALSSKRTNLSFAEADVARLDKQLDDAYAALPEPLRMRPMSKSLVDNAETILRRISLCLRFQGAKCLLHYHFSSLLPSLLQGQHLNGHDTGSHETTIRAALQILQCQRILYEETQVSGRLYKDRWRVSSLLKDPCLMATAVLCSELDGPHGRPQSSREDGERIIDTSDNIIMTNPALPTQSRQSVRAEIIQTLHDCCLVWTHLSGTSFEASKAAEAVRTVLNKMQDMSVDLSPTVDTRSIVDFTMNNSIMVPGNSIAENSSRGFDLLDHGAQNLVSNMQHDSTAHQLNEVTNHTEIGQNAQMEYNPLSPSQLNTKYDETAGFSEHESSVGLQPAFPSVWR
ncbi:putative Transcription factor [Talaromyces atroroseus]|uniref:Putative Transcription factor n=1 Tax=Talaromyces atroroseus TaxID=1441469 RepID=A0A1Q5Q6M2_TALAT|nr:putative Transcription factor [Talaromyces atroroseus]OKL55494.1 putative Transcription factor [Talaromyces atroroseus]